VSDLGGLEAQLAVLYGIILFLLAQTNCFYVKKTDLSLSPHSSIVYPIKSCKGFEIRGSWEIADHGFAYDREWMVVDETGSGINQKKVWLFSLFPASFLIASCEQVNRLCQIQPFIDLNESKLYVDAPGIFPTLVTHLVQKVIMTMSFFQGMTRLSLDLNYFPEEVVTLNVCGDAGSGQIYKNQEVREWYDLAHALMHWEAV